MSGRSSRRFRWAGAALVLAMLAGAGHAQTDGPVPFPDVLTLEQALRMLDGNYPDVMAAQAAIRSAEASLLSLNAVHSLKAHVEAEVRQSDRHIPSRTDFIDDSRMRLIISKPLTDFGLTRTRLDGAGLGLDASREQYRRIRADNRLNVIRAFLEVILSDYAYIVADEDMTLAFLRYDRKLERMERFEDANPIEVGELETLYLDKFAVRTAVGQEQRKSRLRLALVLNRPDAYPDQMVEPDTSAYDRPVPDYDEILARILDHAPEIRVARLNVESSRKRLEAARMVRPTLGLQLEATGYSESYPGSRDDLRASAFLRIPLYPGVSRDAEVARAAAEVERNQAALGSIEHALRMKVLDLVQQLGSNRNETDAASTELDYRERELDRIRLEYELDYRASIGAGNLNVAKALHRVIRTEYERVLIWEQLDALAGGTLLGADET